MKRNKELIEKRKKFIDVAMNNPKKAAQNLRVLALGLENCRSTKDITYALKEIIFVSDATIFFDYAKN